MTSSRNRNIVIVGAGIIGISIAYHLSIRNNISITVLDSDIPGSGATEHSFAWVNAFGKEPRTYHTLNRRSLDMWYRLSDQLDSDIGIHHGGELRWENTENGAKTLINRVRQLQGWGYPCRIITKDELVSMEPDLSPGNVLASSYSNADFHIETDKFMSVILNKVIENGISLHSNTPVIDFKRKNDRIYSVITSETEFPCDIVVLAAGVNTTSLADKVDVYLPQQCSPGVIIKTTKCKKIMQNAAIIHAPSKKETHQHIHMRQLDDGTLRIGQGTQEGINSDDSQEHADALLDNLKTYFPAVGMASAITTPVGYRPMPIDGYPVIGFTKSVSNLYITLMHSGVTLAPIISEMATIEIVDGINVEWFVPYRPNRFNTV
ncbi:FAD-binding oxidoreductase [Candidatus Poribacteria bacterium]|nr:FAD-binding oxidoreductase [Candidatus Poribacteria bacterium]